MKMAAIRWLAWKEEARKLGGFCGEYPSPCATCPFKDRNSSCRRPFHTCPEIDKPEEYVQGYNESWRVLK